MQFDDPWGQELWLMSLAFFRAQQHCYVYRSKCLNLLMSFLDLSCLLYINILCKLIYLIHQRPFDYDQVSWLWEMHNLTHFKDLYLILHIFEVEKLRLQGCLRFLVIKLFLHKYVLGFKSGTGRARIWTLLFLTQSTDILVEGINDIKIFTWTIRTEFLKKGAKNETIQKPKKSWNNSFFSN